MSTARRRRLTTLALVAAVLMAGLIGSVDATQKIDSQHLVTGHTEFADAQTSFNSCFAGLAGALLHTVTWFNGQTLFSRMDSGGNKHVYVTEHFQDKHGNNDGNGDGFDDHTGIRINDPTDERLYRTNQTYKFTDRNNPDKEWVVREYFALRDVKDYKNGTSSSVGGEEIHAQKAKVYVFVVEVGDAIFDPTVERDYNFAMVIDTCRFHQTGNTTEHNGTSGDSGAPVGQHEDQTGMNETHTHDEFSIDVWVAGAPNSQPVQVPDDRGGNESVTEDAEDGNP